MAQSLSKIYLHIVYSTKQRQPLIDRVIEAELYRYLGSICNSLGSLPIKIGGYADHVHILCTLSKKITSVKLLEDLKSHSSKWIKKKGQRYANFYWQGGYGAFSVSPSEVDAVIDYIGKQHEHHKLKTFQDEFREILKLNNIDFDERYVWD